MQIGVQTNSWDLRRSLYKALAPPVKAAQSGPTLAWFKPANNFYGFRLYPIEEGCTSFEVLVNGVYPTFNHRSVGLCSGFKEEWKAFGSTYVTFGWLINARWYTKSIVVQVIQQSVGTGVGSSQGLIRATQKLVTAQQVSNTFYNLKTWNVLIV